MSSAQEGDPRFRADWRADISSGVPGAFLAGAGLVCRPEASRRGTVSRCVPLQEMCLVGLLQRQSSANTIRLGSATSSANGAGFCQLGQQLDLSLRLNDSRRMLLAYRTLLKLDQKAPRTRCIRDSTRASDI
jgi:hypothetical protein